MTNLELQVELSKLPDFVIKIESSAGEYGPVEIRGIDIDAGCVVLSNQGNIPTTNPNE